MMWNNVVARLAPGQQVLTPGRGIPPSRQSPFFVVAIAPSYIDIEIGRSRTANRLSRQMFDAIHAFFEKNPQAYLRIAAEHSTTPTPDSVDALVRAAVSFPRAIGNYVSAILEAVGCVRYLMVGNRKCIELPFGGLDSLMSLVDLTGVTTEKALQHMGHLIDRSFDFGSMEGLLHSIELLEKIQKRELADEELALSHYFMANAYADIRHLSRGSTDRSWGWEQGEIEKEIFHLRTALQTGHRSLPDERICQVLTNLANLMNEIGRFVEAVEYWDRALEKVPLFPMARGNRGFGLSYYARSLYDKGHAIVFLRIAHGDLAKALSFTLHEDAKKGFAEHKKSIESVIPEEELEKEFDMNSFSLGDTEEEIEYRKWCLKNRLFLNPLNDLGPYSIGGRDILTTPNIVVGIGEGPYYAGYFNQIKQEYVSARYLYYEGMKAESPHFSDRQVLLYNTLDYPSYSLAVEKMRAAFRMIYSLFDKIAFFLNHYLRLSIPERRVSFRTIWYVLQSRKKGLRKDFHSRQNWPLRGLFWLSKDLYENKPGFKESIELDAQELNEIRNQLEHKYLKLHEEVWFGHSEQDHEVFRALADTLAYSMYRRDFENKALRLLKVVRAALIYLSLAIHREEQRRKKERGPDIVVPRMPLDVWEDEWKV